ncbi:MAG: M48 family metallopeptidase [Clostridiales bacterium]|nr:M48 family metallopeptidase [Clostridiales bacterium]
MVKIFIIFMYLTNKAFNMVIEYLNKSYLKKELPDNVKDVYNEGEYKRFLSYREESRHLGLISSAINILITLLILILNIHAWLFGMISGLNVYVQYLIVVAIFTVLSMVIDLPFDYYDTFVIEEKYGLNKSTKMTFALDTIKETVLGTVISYALIVLIMVLFEKFGNMAIIWCTLAMIVIAVIIMLIIIPLMRIFNKFEPLEEGELKDKLLALCDKYGVRVKRIVVKDASRRTTTSNAFCTGIGNRKTISLDDNLVNAYSADEITAVFAHEFAHAKFRHVIKSLPFSVLGILISFVSLAIVLNIPSLYTAFGFDGMNYYFAQMMSGVIIWPLSTAMGIVGNYISRKHEYQADAFAAKEGYGQVLISALKRLSKESLSGVNPHPAMVILNYSHPTLSQRIDAIRKCQNDEPSD